MRTRILCDRCAQDALYRFKTRLRAPRWACPIHHDTVKKQYTREAKEKRVIATNSSYGFALSGRARTVTST